MNSPTTKERRHKGKPLARMKQSTVDTIILALAMELRDDITLLRMRADQLLTALNCSERVLDAQKKGKA